MAPREAQEPRGSQKPIETIELFSVSTPCQDVRVLDGAESPPSPQSQGTWRIIYKSKIHKNENSKLLHLVPYNLTNIGKVEK